MGRRLHILLIDKDHMRLEWLKNLIGVSTSDCPPPRYTWTNGIKRGLRILLDEDCPRHRVDVVVVCQKKQAELLREILEKLDVNTLVSCPDGGSDSPMISIVERRAQAYAGL